MPPADVDDRVLAELAAAVAGVPAFDCVFPRTEWFGTDVVWLAPEPDGPFVALSSPSATSADEFPPAQAAVPRAWAVP